VSNNERKQLEIEIAHLQDLDLDGLRRRWRTDFGRTAPGHIPKYLLLRLLAYRAQAQVLGDLSRATVLFLDGLARAKTTEEVEAVGGVSVPGQNLLKPGTVLVREHDGANHHVMVTDDGFVWNGSTYPSLTKIAFAITGTRWNGPRFFGLRDSSTGAQS
jgi:hypothetical protein